MGPSLATFAEYYRLGLEAGLLLPESAKNWAMSVVEELAEPPGEIIEISWSKGAAMTLENLRAVQGERDRVLAAHWLLASLREANQTSDDELHRVVQRAMQIAQAAELGGDVYNRFDAIDDELSLARSNTYGSVIECRKELADALSEYPSAPVRSET